MSVFEEWLNAHHALTAKAAAVEKKAGKDGTFTLVRDAMEIAWDAALGVAARAIGDLDGGERDRDDALREAMQAVLDLKDAVESGERSR